MDDPRRVSPSPGNESEPGSQTSGATLANDPRGLVVLCLDDDPAVLAALKRLLRAEPYRVVTASKAAHALAFLRLHQVDVIIADQRMPDMSGSDFLAEIVQHWPRIRRVLLTAYPSHSVLSDGFRIGIDSLIKKPWDDEALKSAIRRLLASSPENEKGMLRTDVVPEETD